MPTTPVTINQVGNETIAPSSQSTSQLSSAIINDTIDKPNVGIKTKEKIQHINTLIKIACVTVSFDILKSK